MNLKEFEGKNIYTHLNSGKIYSGVVLEVTYLGKNVDDIDLYMFTIKDKFGKIVCFHNSEIKYLEEKG